MASRKGKRRKVNHCCRLSPIVHGTTFDALRQVSPSLAARSGLDTAGYSSREEVATKIADSVLLD